MNFDQVFIKGVKLIGKLDVHNNSKRNLRVSCGKLVFHSPKPASVQSSTAINFPDLNARFKKEQLQEPVNLQCYAEHAFADSEAQYKLLLHASLNAEDIRSFRGEFLELSLLNTQQEKVGVAVLVLEVFQKYKGFWQKVSSQGAIQKPVRQVKLAPPKNVFKQIMAQDFLSSRLMTISSVVCHIDNDDVQVAGNECTLLVRYGKLRFYTKPIRKYKEELIWTDYIQFAIDEKQKFEFFLLCINEVDDVQCKAKGEIKYVVFDQTITAHQIVIYDQRRKRYGTIHVKFAEIQFKDMKGGVTRLDKRIREVQPKVESSLAEFNKVYFDNKYNAHILSQSLREKQLQELEEIQKSRPLNAEEIKIKEENKKFVDFLQRQLIKFDVEQQKKERIIKIQKHKTKFLPLINSRASPQKNIPLTSRRYGSVSVDHGTSNNEVGQVGGSMLVLPKLDKLPRQ